jgi:hypothetical protein
MSRREWLLYLLQVVEHSCGHPLNCDALAWKINKDNREHKQMLIPQQFREMEV